jgi:hypothetical protein
MIGLACGAFLGWGPELMQVREPQHLRLLFIFLVPHLPYALLFFSLYKGWEQVSAALAAGIAIVSIHFGALLLFATGLLGGGMKEREFLPMISLLPGAIVLAVGAVIAFLQSKTKRATFGAMVAGCLGIFILYFGAWDAWSNPPAPNRSEYLDEQPIYHAYNHINACNQLYARENPDKGFAASLDQLGPAGIQCLTGSEVAGPVGNRKLKYEPGAQQNGRIASYHLATMDPGVFQDTRHIETDESGIVFTRSKTGVIALSNYATTDFHFELNAISNCLQDEFKQTGSFPKQLEGLTGRALGPCNRLSDYRPAGPNTLETTRRIPYRFTYAPMADSSANRFVNFTLCGRPLHYGQDAIRSYVTSKDGVIHGTPEDRCAAVTDPRIPSIEW